MSEEKRPSEEGRKWEWPRLDKGFGLNSLTCLFDPRTEAYHFKLNGRTYTLLIEKVIFRDGKILPKFGTSYVLFDHPVFFEGDELEEASGLTGDLEPVRASRPFTLKYCWGAILYEVRRSVLESAPFKRIRQDFSRFGAKALGWLFR